MAICPVITVVEKASNKMIVVNESDFDSNVHKRINEDAPRTTIDDRDNERVTTKGKKFTNVSRAAKKAKR